MFVCEIFRYVLFESLCIGQYFLVAPGDEVFDKLVFIVLISIGDPLFKGRGGKLFHEDVPMVEIGVHFSIWISLDKANVTFDGFEKEEHFSVGAGWESAAAEVTFLFEPGLDFD